MSVTVVSCVYGHYTPFVTSWREAVAELDPAPDAVIVATDAPVNIPGARVVESLCDWRHRQAFYLQLAIQTVETKWAWIVDIDDLALPDGLQGLEKVSADVWQMGFQRSDGETYLPPWMSNLSYLKSDTNIYTGASAIRVEAFHAAGGFPDIALQDWGLWRRMARSGAMFEPSGRAHFRYMRHPGARGETELTVQAREEHLAEMMEAELAHA